MKISIGQAAKELGVSIHTLLRWEADGKIHCERTPKDHRREEELAQDVLEIITVFSARLYGSSSHNNRKVVKTLREMAGEL